MSVVTTEVPTSVCSGAAGSICDLIVAVQVPSSALSIACCGPGVAALVIFSIIAACSLVIWGGASAATAVSGASRTSAAAANQREFIGTSGREVGGGRNSPAG